LQRKWLIQFVENPWAWKKLHQLKSSNFDQELFKGIFQKQAFLSKPKEETENKFRKSLFEITREALAKILENVNKQNNSPEENDLIDNDYEDYYESVRKRSNSNQAFNPLKFSPEFELNWIKKKADNLRHSYLAKLVSTRVWDPSKKEKIANSLIIFDWDDTLLCTSFLTPNGIFNDKIKIGEKLAKKLEKLDEIVFAILNYSIEHGETYIITNAAPGWVEYSAKRFYPNVSTILNKIKIVSARGEFEKKVPWRNKKMENFSFFRNFKIYEYKFDNKFDLFWGFIYRDGSRPIFVWSF